MGIIRGVLFDLDGVLADTERVHWQAYRTVLLEYGVDVGLEEYGAWFTTTGRGPEYVCRTYGLPLTPDELRARKAPVYLELLHRGVTACAGARDAIARLAATHRLAVATNAARVEVDVVLHQLGLDGRFDAIVARADYVHSKPAPDAYLAAATALGLAPAECIVVEDSTRGVQSALAAGIRAIAIPGELTKGGDFSGCVRVLAGLEQLTPVLLREIESAS